MTEINKRIADYFENEVIPRSDQEIAKTLGCGKSSVNRFRLENGIRNEDERKKRNLYRLAQSNVTLKAKLRTEYIKHDVLILAIISFAVIAVVAFLTGK